jgi:DME family drug/metabolite transporter
VSHRFATPVTRGLISVIIAAIAWGTGGVVAAVLYRTTGLGPIAISFWRTAIGVALLGLLSLRRSSASAGSPVRMSRFLGRIAGEAEGRRWWITLVTGVGLAVYQTAYYAAVARSGVAFATVLTLGSAPVLIALGARFAIGERLGPVGVAAVAVAPLGLVLVAGFSGGSLAGVVLSLVSAAGYAVVTVLQRSVGGVDPDRTTLHGFAVAGICLAPLAALEGLWPVRGDLLPTLGLLAYLGVFSTAVAYRLFFASLGSIRATTVSILTLTEPLTAAALAVLVLGERITWTMLAGGLLLLGAVVLLAHAETRTAPLVAAGP